MKRYPHPGYPFKCASSDCAFHVHTPGRKCAMCEASGIGPIESSCYRWGSRAMESFDGLKWFPKTCAILLAVGLIFLIVRMAVGAVETHREVYEWRIGQ